jgi:hypothetical protein
MTLLRAGALAALLALAAAGCGKKEAPPAADAAAEKAAATERIKQNAVYGADVKALEDAKKMGDDINKKAEARDPDAK